MNDSDLSAYSFVPVLGSDGAVVVIPTFDLQNCSPVLGALNDEDDQEVAALYTPDSGSLYDLQSSLSDTSNVLVVKPLEDVERDSALLGMSPSGSSVSISDVGTEQPDYILFNGSVWVTGYDYRLGRITLYFPPDTKDFWGTDTEGHLIYLGSDSKTGYLEGLTYPTVYASMFSYPRYRETSGSAYQNIILVPENSNAPIATGDVPRVTMWDSLPLVAVALLGVILLCTTKLLR